MKGLPELPLRDEHDNAFVPTFKATNLPCFTTRANSSPRKTIMQPSFVNATVAPLPINEDIDRRRRSNPGAHNTLVILTDLPFNSENRTDPTITAFN